MTAKSFSSCAAVSDSNWVPAVAAVGKNIPNAKPSYKDWHVPFSCGDVTLRQAYESLLVFGAKPSDMPLIIRLVENPRFRLPGVTLFHGAVDLKTHDYIHILLGRGLLPIDEAFVIGFTMGSTKNVSSCEEWLYSFISKYFYPAGYRFTDEEIRVFRTALQLGRASKCGPLDAVDYSAYQDCKISEIRKSLGLESDMLISYYRFEQTCHPLNRASQRLLA